MSAAGTAGDGRPAIAIGHVSLQVPDVPASTDFFLTLGIRSVFTRDDFAVLEFRGGTHLVLRPTEVRVAKGERLHFDVMVDDVEAARRDLVGAGLEASEITRGRVHASFLLTTPCGRHLSVTSSHVGKLPV